MDNGKMIFFVYVTTNIDCSKLDCGVTGDIELRLHHLEFGLYGHGQSECRYLLYCECFADVYDALKREKEIRKFSFRKKKKLVEVNNPGWNFLNKKFNLAFT